MFTKVYTKQNKPYIGTIELVKSNYTFSWGLVNFIDIVRYILKEEARERNER